MSSAFRMVSRLSPITTGMMWLEDGQDLPLSCIACRTWSECLASRSRRSLHVLRRDSTNFVHAVLKGGRAVVKINVRMRLTRYSLIVWLHTTYAPTEASALPNVPHRKSMSFQAALFFGYSQPLLSAYSDGMCFVYVKHDVRICFFSSAKRARGAMSPSMLKMLSVTMMILEKS